LVRGIVVFLHAPRDPKTFGTTVAGILQGQLLARRARLITFARIGLLTRDMMAGEKFMSISICSVDSHQARPVGGSVR
jgi:hypothetical protein